MNVKLYAPDSLDEITVGQFQDFIELEEPTEKDVLKHFLGLSDRVISRISQKDIFAVSGKIMGMIAQEKPKFKDRFILDGVPYGFIPSLDDITSGEYDDATEYVPTSEQKEDESFKHNYQDAHKFMAVMFRPVLKEKKGKYLIEDYEGSSKYAEVMKDAPVSVLLGCLDFFFHLLNELLTAIPNYLLREVKQVENGLVKNGENTTDTMNSLRETLNELRRLRNIPYMIAS